jgi:hypothetical protein
LDQVVQLAVLDERSSFDGWEPLRRSLLRLWPVLRLSLDQQWEDLNLTRSSSRFSYV